MNPRYVKGRRLEYQVLEIVRKMEDHIYSTRTPASKSKADIVAIMRDRKTGTPKVILIQCKAGTSPLGSAELDFLHHVRSLGVGAVIAWKPGRAQKKKVDPVIQFLPLEIAAAKLKIKFPKMGAEKKKP